MLMLVLSAGLAMQVDPDQFHLSLRWKTLHPLKDEAEAKATS